MTLWGFRKHLQKRFFYRFFSSATEYCYISATQIGSESIVTICRHGSNYPRVLSSSFNVDNTRVPGLRRYVVDDERGTTLGSLEICERFNTRINDRFLAEDRGTIIRFWDPEHPAEPAAVISTANDPPLPPPLSPMVDLINLPPCFILFFCQDY